MKILTLIGGALVGAVLVFLLMTTVPGAWATNRNATLCQDALARRRQAQAQSPYHAINAQVDAEQDIERYCK